MTRYVKMDLTEICWDSDAWGSIVKTVINHRVPENASIFLTS